MHHDSHAPTRILVVDDQPIARLGICHLISQHGLSVCAETDSADAALQLAAAKQAEFVLMGLSLRQGSSFDLIRMLHERWPSLPILVFSRRDEAIFAERVLRAGARGYLMKQEEISLLVRAIRIVVRGEIYLSPYMSQRVLEHVHRGSDRTAAAFQELTDRELEVLELIGAGNSTHDVAAKLGVSGKTVETYRSHLKRKLQLKDAATLVRYAATWTNRSSHPMGATPQSSSES